MRWVRVGLLWIVVAFFAVRDPGGLAARGLAPYWFLLVALLAGLRASPGNAAFLGWCSGLVADLFSMEPFGMHALAYGAAANLLAKIRQHLFSRHPITQIALGLTLSVLVVLALLLRLEFAEPAFRLGPRLAPAFLAAVITSCLLPLFFKIDVSVGILAGFDAKGRRV